ATRSRQTHDKASADRVSFRKDNWDDRCRLLCCENTYGSLGNDDIDLLPDKLGNDLGCALAASLCPPNLDRDGSSLDPAEFAQPLHESGDPLVLNRSRRWAQEPDSRQLRHLLRARREWPRHRAAEQCDELAPSHVPSALRRDNVFKCFPTFEHDGSHESVPSPMSFESSRNFRLRKPAGALIKAERPLM